MSVEPSQLLENTLRMCHKAFAYAGLAKKYWLSFGGLWGMIQNNGVVPDNDLDFCTYYGEDWQRVAKAMKSSGYEMSHCMVSDVDGKALHIGFNHKSLMHVCLSFWYKWGDLRFYGHDNAHEVQGVGCPKSGYWFKGMPSWIVDNDQYFKYSEWPGINQAHKVRVPLFAGSMLDNEYLCWGYTKQRYVIDRKHSIDPERMASIHKGGVASRFTIHLDSMSEWGNDAHIKIKLDQAHRAWWARAKQAIAK